MTNASALLLAADSWGGVAPMITLAEALHGLGVNARIAAYSDFSEKVRAAGYEFTDLGVSAAGFWAGQNAQRPDCARLAGQVRSSCPAPSPSPSMPPSPLPQSSLTPVLRHPSRLNE